MQDWTPGKQGNDFELPWILEPLKDLRDDFCVLTGLRQQKANANGDGDGGSDFARALTTLLTSVQAKKLDESLKVVREGGQSLLDQCMIVDVSGIAEGNAHNHDNLPILLAGRGGEAVQSGRHLKYSNDTPLTNLDLSMLDRLSVKCEKLDASNGRQADLGSRAISPR